MNESARLLNTTASDVTRHLSNREYGAAVDEILSLTSPIAAAYVVAVTMNGLAKPIASRFQQEIKEALDEVAKHRASGR